VRARVAELERERRYPPPGTSCRVEVLRSVLAVVAVVYADHRDFREEWVGDGFPRAG